MRVGESSAERPCWCSLRWRHGLSNFITNILSLSRYWSCYTHNERSTRTRRLTPGSAWYNLYSNHIRLWSKEISHSSDFQIIPNWWCQRLDKCHIKVFWLGIRMSIVIQCPLTFFSTDLNKTSIWYDELKYEIVWRYCIIQRLIHP